MRFLGYDLTLRRVPSPRGSGGWLPIVREPSPGAWQANLEVRGELALAYFAVYACVSLIASDAGKISLRLVEVDADGIWTETTNPAYSPVLRRPNRYQTRGQFIKQWIVSKLVHGNTYALKQRDARGVVSALYILEPSRVTPLVAPDGAVYYQLEPVDLANLPAPPEGGPIIVPAREIIHDLMVPLFHPLCGVSPLYACGYSAIQGQTIQRSSSQFFAGGSKPGGILLAPGPIGDDVAKRLKEYWDSNFTGDNAGKIAVLGDNLKFEPLAMTAVDAQLIDQLKWTADTVCSCYHVPAYMIDLGPPPPYANVEPLLQKYYAQCLQSLLTDLEAALDAGLELIPPYGTEFDIDDLIWMDTATRTKAAADAIGAGALSPNEARKKYFGLGAVAGGDTPYMQQQMFSLAALAERDADQPFSKPTPPAAPVATVRPYNLAALAGALTRELAPLAARGI